MKKGSTVVATFVYDGDGNRVKSTINGVTTYFVGSHYEVTGSTVTKYYGVYPELVEGQAQAALPCGQAVPYPTCCPIISAARH